MTPFRLKAKLRTPVILGKNPVNLAGLLYHCCLLHTCEEDKAAELLCLLLDQSHGVYHGSNMVFAVSFESPLIATTISTSGQMRTGHDLSPDKIKPNGARGAYSKVQVEGGPYKNRIENHPSYSCKEVYFYGKGDAEKVFYLVNYYVNALGMYANLGISGAIEYWEISDMHQDYSFFMPNFKNTDEKILVNRLPTNTQQSGVWRKQICNLTPPFYKHDNEQECWISDRILKTQVS